MKTFITISVVVVTLIGLAGLFLSLKGDIAAPPVVASAGR
jgi:hypothetical protein